MKALLALAALVLTAASSPTQQPGDIRLPELHKIKTATLAPSYSCRSKEEFRRGYDQTALFLSSYGEDRNAPDLLFNGACGSEDYFEGGDPRSLIADLGSVALETVTTQSAFNLKRMASYDLSKFAQEAKVEANHTYVLLINKSEVRGLFLFSVVNYVPNKKVDIRYAVKEYQLLNVRAQSEGFSWEAKNTTDCGSTPLALTAASSPTQQPRDVQLPELHKIKTATLAPNYGCRSKEEFRRGYDQTALFLSSYGEDRDRPDLLFNGVCGSEDYFEGSTGGDDMSLIADLGTVALESVTAHLAFNTRNVHSFDLYSAFVMKAKVEANHTYALLINKSDVRGLVLFSVVNYSLNKKVDLKYAVKEYQLLNVRAQSEGFDWEARNTADCACK